MNVFVMMECKKNCRFGSLCRVLHSAKDAFAKRNGHNTRQSWQNGRPENRFSSFAECCDYNTRQRNLKKKILNFAECLEWWHSAKKISKKNKSSLPSAFRVDARQRIFQKKIKNLCRVPRKMVFRVPIFSALSSAMTMALGNGVLCRVQHSAK